MSNEPEKLFDLMDIETEPTDKQLEQLMGFVAEEVRRKQSRRPSPPTPGEISALTNKLLAELAASED